jgi:uncharacterized membrane protein (UPF0127 family)
MRKIIFLLMFIFLGCSQSSIDRLPSGKVVFGGDILHVEIAADQASQARGLMFRRSLPANDGILFDFGEPGIYRFWMKNTYIPLSIAFLDESGKILKIEDMEPQNLEKRYSSPPNTRYAIEVNQGWFDRYGIRVGDQAVLPAVAAARD